MVKPIHRPKTMIATQSKIEIRPAARTLSGICGVSSQRAMLRMVQTWKIAMLRPAQSISAIFARKAPTNCGRVRPPNSYAALRHTTPRGFTPPPSP